MSNGVWRGNLEVEVSCHQEVDKLRIRDNDCREITLSYPLCNVGTDVLWDKEKYCNNSTYWNSGVECIQWEYAAACCLLQAKWLNILPLWLVPGSPLATMLIESLPKQQITWCHRLAVDKLSPLSWKCWTPPAWLLHFAAEQVKKWETQPLCTWIVISFLKNEYIRDLQIFWAATENWNEWQIFKKR